MGYSRRCGQFARRLRLERDDAIASSLISDTKAVELEEYGQIVPKIRLGCMHTSKQITIGEGERRS